MKLIYFCDDDPKAVAKGREVIKDYSLENGINLKFSSFKRAEDMLFHMADHYELPDIIFLDIFMDELNGMETAKRLRKDGFEGEIIFLTTSPDYVFEAFDVQSFHYLVKQELSKEQFISVLSRAIEAVEERNNDFFDCSMGAEKRRILFQDISHFEIYRRVMRVHYGQKESFDFYETMDRLAEDLVEKSFVRTHRSYLVNMNHITQFKTDSIILSNQKEIPLGKTYRKSVKASFDRFIKERWHE